MSYGQTMKKSYLMIRSNVKTLRFTKPTYPMNTSQTKNTKKPFSCRSKLVANMILNHNGRILFTKLDSVHNSKIDIVGDVGTFIFLKVLNDVAIQIM